jgi:hypothetical protein
LSVGRRRCYSRGIVSPNDDTPREPVFTPRLQLGFGLLAFGVGLMFLAGKVLPLDPGGHCRRITLAFAGFVVVVLEALRAGPTAGGRPRRRTTRPRALAGERVRARGRQRGGRTRDQSR